MKVLFVASEAVPFIKTGGLADVIGSLPVELRKLGVDARVILPKYGEIAPRLRDKMVLRKNLAITMGWRYQYYGILETEHSGVPFYFIDNDYFFNRRGLYGFEDDAERFAFFSHAVLKALPHLDFVPQYLHCNDWHTGMVSVFLKAHYERDPFYKDIRTLFTIHNLGYQGLFPLKMLEELLELEPEYFTMDGIEFFGQGSYLKGGLVFSDFLTTVSKTYAAEIQAPSYGEGLDGLLKQRNKDLEGIRNGIDYRIYDPMSDPEISIPFRSSLVKKHQNKLFLQKSLGLPQSREIPLLAFINRFVEQKGLDLITYVIKEILAMNVQLVILGTGEKKYRDFFQRIFKQHPDKFFASFNFDDSLARKIYAGSDLFLMPSLYEPCGIGQMIAMRYGSIPIVRETGGLKDTVKPFDISSGEGNGFIFTDFNAHEMLYTIKKAVNLYQNKQAWARLIKNAVRMDYSWDSSARKYLELYQRILKI
ncbi:MAG: glycogen synthase GlgA [Dethiobacter sp.]|jgi:starch synthase|nr:MAG: glycogen synthase GlgA [Dethiobacter sp.]